MFSFDKGGYLRGYESWYRICNRDSVPLWLSLIHIFSANRTFAGTVAAVNAFRILNEEQESTHLNEISAEYKKKYFEGCGKSLSCHDICPIGLPVEELLVRSNAAAVWDK